MDGASKDIYKKLGKAMDAEAFVSVNTSFVN